MAFGGAAISIAFLSSDWALVRLTGTAYYCLAVDCIGAVYAIGMVVLMGFQSRQELQFKLVNIALSTIFAIVAISAGIIYAVNAHDAFLLNKYGVYIIRGSTLAAASVSLHFFLIQILIKRPFYFS